MDTSKLNPLRHYYLYAKGHYHRSENIFDDLKQIHSQWCAVSAEHLEDECIVVKLLEMTYTHIAACSDDRMFIEFVSDIHPRNTWKAGSKLADRATSWETEEGYWLRVARKCLSMLSITSRDQWPFDLGEADAKVLPLRKKN